MILMILLSSRAGSSAGSFGPRLFMTLSPLLMAGGAMLLFAVGEDFVYWWQMLPGMSLRGLGLSLAVASLTAALLTAALVTAGLMVVGGAVSWAGIRRPVCA